MNTSLSLDSLASAINAAHERVTIAYRTALDDAKSAGELLLQAKGQVPYGQWGNWVEQNCTFSDRTCQMYMQIAKNWQDINERSATVADLGVRAAIESIADKSAPEVTNKKVTPSTAPAKPLVAPRKPDIQPGDRITVTDETSPEYGQELEVAEVVQDAIALVRKGNETYPLLVNQVEVVERQTLPSRLQPESIKPILKNGGTSGAEGVTSSLPQDSLALHEPPKNMAKHDSVKGGIKAGNSNGSDTQGLEIPQRNTSPITVAALQDILRRILDECEEYLPQELIDEAKELLK